MLLIFVGPPGSGKGTMASKLKEFYNYETFSTGDALRDEVKKNTELGKIIDAHISKGLFVSDEIVNQIIGNHLDTNTHLILDGYPRNVTQAHLLDNMLKKIGKKIDKVVYFNVEDEILVDRIVNRLVCPNCNSIYHRTALKPSRLWFCDKCQTELTQRQDDNEESLRERLSIYHSTTEPLISLYRDRGLLAEVAGDYAKIDDRFEVLKRVLNL